MYIKLTFTYSPWIVPHASGGVIASLKDKPEIVSKLPKGVKAGVYGEEVQRFLGKEVVEESFFYNCSKLLDKNHIQSALAAFKHHYKEGLPSVGISGRRPEDNEIIQNLSIAVHNIMHPDDIKPFECKDGGFVPTL